MVRANETELFRDAARWRSGRRVAEYLFSVRAGRANGARTLVRRKLVGDGALNFPSADLPCRRSCGINPAPPGNSCLAR